MSSLSIFKETSRVQIPLTYSIKLCFNSSTQLLDGYKPDMERWQMYRYNAILSNIGVRLNLINHFVGFISCQFACNSTLRNPVFRWESCKGIVWESEENAQDCALKQGLATGSCEWLATGKSPEDAHEWSMQRSWTIMPTVAL